MVALSYIFCRLAVVATPEEGWGAADGMGWCRVANPGLLYLMLIKCVIFVYGMWPSNS